MTIVDDLLADLQVNAESRRKFIKDILRPALAFVENEEKVQADAIRQTNIDNATIWWTNNALPLLNNPITTRDEALQNYTSIKNVIESQTDKWKLYILNKKLQEAEANFIEAKKGNLPIVVT